VTDQIPENMDEVGAGWHPLLERLHAQLLDVVPGYTVAQVKEKFGGLRVHLDYGDRFESTDDQRARAAQAETLVEAAEDESERTCEYCGRPGEPRPGGWVKTMCDGCHGGQA
jgi:thiamine biosynthesis protein ThiC